MHSHSLFLFPDLDQPGTLALRPMQISGAVRPIEDADGGINIWVVEENASGVLCVIAAYLDMLEGDQNDIYWNGILVFTRMVEPGEKDKHLFFYLPKALFTPGLHECFYELKRFGATKPDDPSVLSQFFVKLTSPGGRDREPHLPDGHSELHIARLPQEIIDQGVIDAEWAKKGIPLTIPHYPEIRVRDTILMRWGSHTLAPHLVTQAQADGSDPIVIVAKQEDILAGGDSTALEIKYDPHDEVWNWSSRHSKRTRIAVDAGAWRLPAPIIKQSVNGTIKIVDLNQQDVTVQVHIQGSDFALNDSVKMTWIGTPFTGKPLIHTESKTVANIPSVMEFNVPYMEVRAIAMGRADASYVLTKADGTSPMSSKREFADVVGDVLILDAPRIAELVGDILEPDLLYATVRISYTGIANGDWVAIRWIGEKSNGQPYVHEDSHTVSDNEAKEGFFTVYVDKEHIIVLDKGRLDLWYTVSNDKPKLYGVSDSEHLLVKVQAVAATLPAPGVEEENPPGILDPSNISDKATVLIDYTGTVREDILTYYWMAPNPVDSVSDWIPITTLIAGKPVRFRVDARFVTSNIGQLVKVRYSLWRAATRQYEYSAELNLLVSEPIGKLIPPEVRQAPNGTLDPIQGRDGVDVLVRYPSMKPYVDKITLKWLGTPGEGSSEDQELPGDASGVVEFHLNSSVVGPNVGKQVQISYVVDRYGKTTDSQVLDLLVDQFKDPEKELPRPDVPQALNDVLDLIFFSGNAQVLVRPWPFIALKQRLWLRLQGKTDSGVDYEIKLLDGMEISDAQVRNGLNETLLRSELMKLDHSTPATVICKVTLDGSTLESGAIEFPHRRLTIRTRYDYLTPEITLVTDSKGAVVQGGITFDKSVTVTGKATVNERIRLRDGASSVGEALTDDAGEWRVPLTGLAEKSYSLTALALYGDGAISAPPRTFRVAAAVQPTITSVTDKAGNNIVDDGSTTQPTVAINGRAPENATIDLYDGTALLRSLPVTNDVWSLPQTGFAPGGHTITARSTNGTGLTSTVRRFTSVAGLTRDFTDFANQNWNNWVGGPGVDPRDLRLRNVSGNWRFHNYTYTNRSNGVIIQKTLNNLLVGRQYRFSIKAIRFQGAYEVPSLSIRAAGNSIAGPTRITSLTNWVTLSGTFIATATNIIVDVYSNVSTGIGNDYEIDDIEIAII